MKFVTKRGTPVHIEGYDEKRLIAGMRNGDADLIKHIYKRNITIIKKMTDQFPNMVIDAEDVLHEGITRVLVNIRGGKFNEQSSVHTYLYSICRNICLKETEKAKKIIHTENFIDIIDEGNESYFELLKTVIDAKNKIDKKCLEIIDLRFRLENKAWPEHGHTKLMPFEKIGELLGIEVENARQRFRRCLKKLIEDVKLALNTVN